MTLQPVKNISEYKRLKETLKNRFENERTGDQDLFREQQQQNTLNNKRLKQLKILKMRVVQL